MNAATMHTRSARPPVPSSVPLRFVGVLGRPQTYRNLAYLLIGLPLGTLWFTVVVTLAAVSLGMVAVALLGVPMLVGTWYVVRACANVERAVARGLLDERISRAPIAAGVSGNPWRRLRTMSSDRARWREVGFLALRLPAGAATFATAVTSIAGPLIVAYTPVHARFVDEEFGEWFWSSELQSFATDNPWSWALLPAGIAMLFVGLHATNTLAGACGRWSAAWLSDRA